MKFKKTASSSLLAAILLIACTQEDVDAANALQNTRTGSIALINGKVYTVNDKQPWAEAVIVKEGKIIFVGSTIDAKKKIDSTMETIDLQGKMVMPGIHDSHTHPLEAGSEVVSCILETDKTINAQLSTIKECYNDDSTGTDWILGWGHDLGELLAASKTKTPLQILDELIPDRPIAIMEATSHSIWVNSAALELAKIDRNSPNPQGGAILKDKDGEPNGILLDTAGDLVTDLAFKPTPELKKANYAGLLNALKQVSQHGITSMVEARLYWKRGYLEAYDQAEREGKLTARTNISVWAYPTMNDVEQLKILKTMYRDNPNSLVRVNQIKLYDDGILHNTTAALLSPYKKTLNGVGSDVGLSYFTQERLTRYITELEKVGYDMHIHAIGDRGVRESLNAIESAQNTNPSLQTRHRLTHVEMVNPSDMGRFKQLDVIADFQLAGDFTKPEHHGDVEPLIGERAYSMLPVRSIYNTGATVTLSSDWDVSTLNPFVGMQNALQRGAQSLPNLDAVIDAYTINAAYLMRQETKTGSIELGKFGDLIVLDQNMFNIPVANINKTKVLLTVLGGKTVYRASTLK